MPSKKSIIPTTVNSDLQKERNKASFDVEEFAIWWHNGEEKLKFKRELEDYMYKDLKGNGTDFHYKAHDEIYEQAVEQTIAAAKKLRVLQQKYNPGGSDIWPGMFTSSWMHGAIPSGNPFAVQFAMATYTVKTQGTDEQYESFGKRLENFEICGTYAQTELGHGTFLRGLETRADFDRETDEFILNTPTITSYKWWPGGLGHSSNYCVLVARLFIDNQPKGVSMFIVQLRDEETHMPLPGIDIGDIGKKIGFYSNNNGYLGLKNVRIPRKNMLMRNAKVERDGTFIESPVSQLTYLTMVVMRCHLTNFAAILLSKAATITTRYSAVRRQSPINPNEPEPQIMDHVTQQLKIFPEIAKAVAFKLSATLLMEHYHATVAEISRGEYIRLPEMHALSCAMKAVTIQAAADGTERLRLACGGHGYLMSADLGPLHADASAACTYEGENTVLLLQVGRYLMKTWRKIHLGSTNLEPTVKYLSIASRSTDFGKFTGEWKNIVEAFQFATAHKVRSAFESLTDRLKAGQSEGEASNNTAIELVQAASLHGNTFIASTILMEITGPKSMRRSQSLNKILENLLELYLVNAALEHLSDIMRFIRLEDADVRSLQNRLEKVLLKLRPDAVAICDGFDFHDRVLNSTLGSYDGNVYERLFEAAQSSPLNKQPVPKSFHSILKPFMKSNM